MCIRETIKELLALAGITGREIERLPQKKIVREGDAAIYWRYYSIP